MLPHTVPRCRIGGCATYCSASTSRGSWAATAGSTLVANLAGAAVTVGGQPRGVTPIAALKLRAPATYDIRVEKAGYVAFSTKVALPPDSEIKVEAELSRRSKGEAWYQRWYVLAAAGLVVAGAGGMSIYFGTRDSGGPAGDGRLGIKVVIQ